MRQKESRDPLDGIGGERSQGVGNFREKGGKGDKRGMKGVVVGGVRREKPFQSRGACFLSREHEWREYQAERGRPEWGAGDGCELGASGGGGCGDA
jgi:hypothetical protein